jgi:hypothetical protein
VWVDGSSQWVPLPTFDLGMKATTPAGTRTRVELAGSYVNATASQNAASLYPGFALVTLTGTESQGAGRRGVASTLQTTYKDWQVSAKMAGDYRFGGVTVTPWVMALGGSARTDQGLTQQGSRAASGVLLFIYNYATSSSVNWVDLGRSSAWRRATTSRLGSRSGSAETSASRIAACPSLPTTLAP